MTALAFSTVALAAPEGETTRWNDTIRDIYIDGHLDRSTQQLASERRLVLLPATGNAVMLDVANGEASVVDRNAFAVADDHTFATAPKTLMRTVVGPLAVVGEGTLVANVEGRNYIVTSHQSHAGPMTADEVWKTAPTWKAIYDHYTPEAAAVKRLSAITSPTHLEIICATWCGDSKRHVPRLLKAVHDAANPKLTVSIVGIGNDFKQPIDYVQAQRIINVPIVLVTREGNEIGRFIETPATTSVETDIAAIANGEAPSHPGRYERKELLGSGLYRLQNAQGAADGTESFEIYRSPSGGVLLHDVIDRTTKGSIETWAALDEHHAPDFAEVTERSGEHIVRTRYHADQGKWFVTSRGDEGGIVQQTMTAPAAFSLPATPTLGWLLYAPRRDAVDTYVVDTQSPNAVGKLATLRVRKTGEKFLVGDATITVSGELNLPRVVELPDGSRRTYVSVETP
jgi:hypothetical protein